MCTGSFLPSLASELLLMRALSWSWTLFVFLSMSSFQSLLYWIFTDVPSGSTSRQRAPSRVVQFQDGGFLQDGLGFGGAFAGLVDSDEDLLLHLIGVDADQVA